MIIAASYVQFTGKIFSSQGHFEYMYIQEF